MSFQKQTTLAKKTQGYDPEKGGGVLSLIDLAANLDDPLFRGTIGKLSIILRELNSINTTRTQQLRRSQALRRCVE